MKVVLNCTERLKNRRAQRLKTLIKESGSSKKKKQKKTRT